MGKAIAKKEEEDEDWTNSFSEPQVEWVAPVNQVCDLTEEDLNALAEPIILKNKNPWLSSNFHKYDFTRSQFVEEPPLQFEELMVHTDIKGFKLHKESTLAQSQQLNEQKDEDVKDNEEREVAKNQFNYSDRASQTFNNPKKDRGVSTKPPELRQYAGTVSQWEIYDVYVGKFLENIKDQEILNAATSKKKKKNNSMLITSETTTTTQQSSSARDAVDIVHSADMGNSLKLLERMVNQNAEMEIYEDFKYWEDQSDKFRDGEGSLLPLWRFSNERTKRKQVTAICWNPSLPDLFAVAYGSYDFLRQSTGMICCYSLKNTSHPEYSFTTESGVMSLDFHPQAARSALLAVGCYDGTVMVYDVRSKLNKPIYVSTIKTGKHTDPVWQVKWQEEDIAKELGFFSISSDGIVANWVMSKSNLKMETVMQLKLVSDKADEPDDETALSGFAGGCCFDFNTKSEHLFLVGTEEGRIHKCSKAYSGQYLETYEGHHMAVYAVKWNKFHPRVFLSCGADWTVKLWDHNVPHPIMSFDLGNPVGDVEWSPYSSTVFAACTSDGKVHVFDLHENKHEPLCEQKVVKKAKLTHLNFSKDDPVLLVGDDRGSVNSLKLSPNLRKTVPQDEMVSRIEKLLQVDVSS